jgi:alkanesulfonate monooxygenase SsuD/methylene tetrahydromethanopterin reductase-like flavin-dependent oxidoreductase (luciferase family)
MTRSKWERLRTEAGNPATRDIDTLPISGIVDLMTREDTSSFDGSYYKLKDARSRPGSVQKPRPPLVLGAFGPRMLKIVATC